ELSALRLRTPRLPIEPDVAAAVWVCVQPLGLHPLVRQLETIGVPDRLRAQDKIYFEQGRLPARRVVELEGLAGNCSGCLCPVGERSPHRITHELEGIELVRLARRVGSEHSKHRMK